MKYLKKQPQIDFLGIGAQKCGTTWLFENLKKKSSFSLLPIKELHYFDRSTDYSSPNKLSETYLRNRVNRKYIKTAVKRIIQEIKIGEYKNAFFYFKWYFSNYNDNWYLSLFKSFGGIKGEITPSYSILKKADITKMYELCPNAKLVFMVRNPIDRAWSHYRHGKKEIKKNVTDNEIIEFIESESQTLRSDYIRTLNNFSEIFPKDQILIGFYDSIIEHPNRLLNDVIHFLQGTSDDLAHDPQTKRKLINKSIEFDCPNKVFDYLKNKYHDQIKELSDQYGGYFNKWYEDTYKTASSNKNKKLLPTMYMKS